MQLIETKSEAGRRIFTIDLGDMSVEDAQQIIDNIRHNVRHATNIPASNPVMKEKDEN